MKKKLLALLTATVMIFSSMALVGCGTEDTAYPNCQGVVYVENSDCQHLQDAEVRVSIANDSETVTLPLTYSEEWCGYYVEDSFDEVAAIIEEVAPDYDAALEAGEDTSNILEEHGYTVTAVIEDNDDQHDYTVTDITCDFLTAYSLKVTTDFIANQLVMLYETEIEDSSSDIDIVINDEGTATINGEEVTFDMFVEEYGKVIEDEEELAALEEYKGMKDALEDGSYPGKLTFTVNVSCTCPVLTSYSLYHEYYDANGEYVAQEYVDMSGEEGETVAVKDIELMEEYDGQKYQLEGVYLFDSETGEWLLDNPIDEYTVSEYMEVLFKYVPAK